MNTAMRFSGIIVVGLCLLAACASAKDEAPAPTPAREIVSGGARIRGGGFRMDVQVGRPLATQPARGERLIVKPNAVVAP
jgi:hypothetical protein